MSAMMPVKELIASCIFMYIPIYVDIKIHQISPF